MATIDEDKLDEALQIEIKEERDQSIKSLLKKSGIRIRKKKQPVDPNQEEQFQQEGGENLIYEFGDDGAPAYYQQEEDTDALGGDGQEPVDMEMTNNSGNIPNNTATIQFETTLLPSQIDNPSANYRYTQPIRKRGQQQKAYARIEEPCPMLDEFARWCDANGDKSAKKRRGEVSKFLAFALKIEAEEYDALGLNDVPTEVVKLISQQYISEYVDQGTERELQGESIRFALDSLKKFVAFVRFSFGLGLDPDQVKRLDGVSNTIVRLRKRNKGKINKEVQQRKTESFPHLNDKTLGDVRAVFNTEQAKRLLKDAKERIRNGTLSHADYNTLLYACAGRLSLYYGLRPEVMKNLRLVEWHGRKTNEDGVVTLAVENHKTKLTRQFQSVVLTKKHARLFEFYLQYARRQLVNERDESDNDPFFIHYKKQCEISQPEDLVKAYQTAVGAQCIYTNREVRHIIETQAKDGKTVDAFTSLAISELLGHTWVTAIQYYVDCQTPSMINALLGLKRLAEAAPVLHDQLEPTDDVGQGENEAGDEPMDVDAQDPATDEIEGENAEEAEKAQAEQAVDQAPGYKTRSKTKETPAPQIPLLPHPTRGTYDNEQKLELIKTQQWPDLKIQPDLPGRGSGLFATKDIEPGRIICDYHGKRISMVEHVAKMERLAKENPKKNKRIGAYALEPDDRSNPIGGERFVIEAHKETRQPSSFGRIINHSIEHPNCKPMPPVELVNRDGTKQVAIFFATTKNVKKGEELLWNYYKHFDDEPWYFQCPCKNPECETKYKAFVKSSK